MKKELLQDIKNAFPDKFSKPKNLYVFELKDLDILFDIANKHIFNERLDRNLVDIGFYRNDSLKEYGQFALGAEGTNKCIINMQTFSNGNKFDKFISVFFHEMIHMYDRYFGKLKDVLQNKTKMYVQTIGGEQTVERYHVHGKYFMQWTNKFKTFGIIVKPSYNDESDKRLMSKLKESFIFFKDKFIEETEVVDDPSYKDHLQNVYDSLDGCPNKEFRYYDKDHWYIRID